jgi:microcin C transport system permease protein
MLSLLFFIGEAVRDAFDPRKLFKGESQPAEPGVQAPGGAPETAAASARAQGGGA